MSEQDNLLKADGKKDTKQPKNEDVAVEIETIKQDQTEHLVPDEELVISNKSNGNENAVIGEGHEKEEDPVLEPVAETESVSNEKTESDTKEPEASGTLEDAVNGTKLEKEQPSAEKASSEVDAVTEADPANLSKQEQEELKVKHNDVALNEIEASNAKAAEDQQKTTLHKVEKKDYHNMSMDELVDDLEKLVGNEKIQSIKSQVDAIKSEFSTQFSTLLAKIKSEFIAEGGDTIDFRFDSPVKKRFNSIFKEFRDKRQAYYKNLEKNLKENLEIRLEIINEIKSLINIEENINTTYKHFKALQESWRNAGAIPRDKYNNVWNNYHHHAEIFYDFLHLNRDLRDLDFKHNLEQKLKLIARAEELAEDNDSNRAFRELQALHKIWKEELGPVDKDHRELIWERFSAATKAIHEKRQVYFEHLDKAYEKNLEKKQDIIAQIHAFTQDETNNHSVWQKKIKSIEALREQFFNAGKVPIKVNEATWTKFKAAVREFNQKKNAFYKGLKKDQYENLQKKLELIKIADENKDNTDFETTTPLMKKVQSDWKNIGHVPRRDSDKIWKQFKMACNHYFNRLHEIRNAGNKEEAEAFEKKFELLDKLKTFEFSDDAKKNLNLIKNYIAEWKSIGRVPFSKRFIDGKFNKAVDALFSKLDLSKTETELLKYDNKLESMAGSDDKRVLDNEHNFLRKKIDDIKAEINQLENNLQFFSNVNDKNPLVKDVHKNIESHKKALEVWEGKLKKIKRFY